MKRKWIWVAVVVLIIALVSNGDEPGSGPEAAPTITPTIAPTIAASATAEVAVPCGSEYAEAVHDVIGKLDEALSHAAIMALVVKYDNTPLPENCGDAALLDRVDFNVRMALANRLSWLQSAGPDALLYEEQMNNAAADALTFLEEWANAAFSY